MIVNMQADGWEIIYHRAHALLAAQIAAHWNQQDSPQRITDTIAAISHHDDLEKEWEKDQLTEAGAPKDFTEEGQTSAEKLTKHIEDALYRGRWVALLTSMHTCFLNQGSKDESSEIAQFLDAQQQLQQQWRKELDISQAEADAAYQFMKWCDRLSLILCQQKIPDNHRKLEINHGPDGQKYYIAKTEAGFLSVFPWCFKEAEFKVYVETSHLSQIKFKDNDELTAALKAAPRQYKEWILRKSQ
ncbi:MAG TPA: DUF3891 family protein [Xenococcaceae cyanobacterium]